MLRRPWLALMLTILIVLTCTGCASLQPTPTPEPVTLKIAYRERGFDLVQAIQSYEAEHPWATVEVVEVDPLNPRWDERLASGDLDMVIEHGFPHGWVAQDLLQPMDDLQLGDWEDIREDYYPGAWDALRLGGQQWGIPVGMDLMVTYVNKDQAMALDAELPSDSWELFDMLELTKSLNYPEGLPYLNTASLYGYCSVPNSLDSLMFVYLHGGTLFDNLIDPSEATLDDPATIEAVQWYADLCWRHGVMPHPDAFERWQYGVYEAQVRGLCGMWFGWFSDRGGENIPYPWSCDYVLLPLPRDRANMTLGNPVGAFITSSSAHPLAALDLARYLCDQPEAAGRALPPRRSLATSDIYQATLDPEHAELMPALAEKATCYPVGDDSMGLVLETYMRAVEQTVAEGLEARDVLQEAQDSVRNAFQ